MGERVRAHCFRAVALRTDRYVLCPRRRGVVTWLGLQFIFYILFRALPSVPRFRIRLFAKVVLTMSLREPNKITLAHFIPFEMRSANTKHFAPSCTLTNIPNDVRG